MWWTKCPNGKVQNATISIEFAKVKIFQGKLVITLLWMLVWDTLFCNLDKIQVHNCKYCTRIKYNVDFKEASELKST